MSKRPIVKEGGTLRLTEEQAAAAVAGGLPVSYSYRSGCRRRIMKGRLVVRGCQCCGIFADISTKDPEKQKRFVNFYNIYSMFEPFFQFNNHD
jgi:hypothetical protein